MRTKIVMLAVTFTLIAGVAFAAATDDNACDGSKGAAFGLCKAFYAVGCGSDSPDASKRACDRIRANYTKITGLDYLPGENTVCRTPTVSPDDPYYERFEGIAFREDGTPWFENSCNDDSDCIVGGNFYEICAAENTGSIGCFVDEHNVCQEFPLLPSEIGGVCGCVQGECIWYYDDGVCN